MRQPFGLTIVCSLKRGNALRIRAVRSFLCSLRRFRARSARNRAPRTQPPLDASRLGRLRPRRPLGGCAAQGRDQRLRRCRCRWLTPATSAGTARCARRSRSPAQAAAPPARHERPAPLPRTAFGRARESAAIRHRTSPSRTSLKHDLTSSDRASSECPPQ